VVKVWKRGTPLRKAKTALEGLSSDVSIGGWHDATPGFERDLVYRSITFYSDEVFLLTRRGLQAIEKPEDSNLTLFGEHMLLELRGDWTVGGKTFKAGSLVSSVFERWQAGDRDLQVLFEPTEAVSLRSVTTTKNHLILTLLDMVASRLDVLTFADGAWSHAPLPGVPELGTLYVDSVDAYESDAYWLTITDFLTPTSIAMGSLGAGAPEVLKQRTARFDATGLVASQHVATSDDGTKVPYFQVAREDVALDGSNPTLLYGYGGFEVSLLPRYSATRGITWLEKGGVYVIANIRGGGEFGPAWHQAALKENRHRAYEDFAAVAEDLVSRGVTSHARLGCEGAATVGCSPATCTRSIQIVSARCSARCRCSTCGGTASCWPERRGWGSTATRMCPSSGRSSRRSRRITTSMRRLSTPRSSSPRPPGTTACTPLTPARWWPGCWSWART
jgi:prolyl oligopeptidase